jgi:hypothetical protein
MGLQPSEVPRSREVPRSQAVPAIPLEAPVRHRRVRRVQSTPAIRPPTARHSAIRRHLASSAQQGAQIHQRRSRAQVEPCLGWVSSARMTWLACGPSDGAAERHRSCVSPKHATAPCGHATSPRPRTQSYQGRAPARPPARPSKPYKSAHRVVRLRARLVEMKALCSSRFGFPRGPCKAGTVAYSGRTVTSSSGLAVHLASIEAPSGRTSVGRSGRLPTSEAPPRTLCPLNIAVRAYVAIGTWR